MWSLFRRQARQTKPARRTPPSVRPRLEALEDRCLMSAPGTLDPTFGTGGITTTSFGKGSNDYGTAVAVQSDGKIVVAGYGVLPTSKGATNCFDVVRYNPNGTLDSSFGTNGEVRTFFPATIMQGDDATRLLLQPDGKILLEGVVNNSLELIRYNSNGSLDTTFGSGGEVSTSFPDAVGALAGMGLETVNGVTKIVAGGTVFLPSGEGEGVLARYNLDGSLDTTFGSGGEVVSNLGYDANFYSLAIQPDGQVILAGGTKYDFIVARYGLSGGLDPTFGNGGIATGAVPGGAMSVAVQPDGKIVAGGEGWNSSGTQYTGWSLERVNSDGSLDSTFGTGGVVSGTFGTNGWWIRELALQTNGKVVAVGTLHSGAFALARYNPDGSLDTSFGSGGEETTAINGGGASLGVALQANGNLVVAGDAPQSAKNAHPVIAVARYVGDPVPVIGSFTANPNPATAGTSVTLTASNISDSNPNSTITQVAFYLNSSTGDVALEPGTDTLLGYASQTSPGVWTLTNSSAFGLSAGTYALFAQAQHNNGVLSDPVTLTLTVQ